MKSIIGLIAFTLLIGLMTLGFSSKAHAQIVCSEQSYRDPMGQLICGMTPAAIQFKLVMQTNLSSIPEVDGTEFYCPNCNTDSTCTAGGTGASVRGVAGVWSCNNTPAANCHGSVTLSTGAGTATAACITATSVIASSDSTANHACTALPGAGSATFVGTASDVCKWAVVNFAP